MVLISSMYSIHGSGRGSGDGSKGSAVLSRSSSPMPSFHTMSLLSLPCLLGLSMSVSWWLGLAGALWLCMSIQREKQNDLRDDSVVPPAGDTKNGISMSSPDGPWSHYGEIPGDEEAIGVAGQETLVAADEGSGMYLGLVAPENRFGLRGSVVGGHGAAMAGLPTAGEGQ